MADDAGARNRGDPGRGLGPVQAVGDGVGAAASVG